MKIRSRPIRARTPWTLAGALLAAASLLCLPLGCASDDGSSGWTGSDVPIPPDQCLLPPLPACTDYLSMTYNQASSQCVYRLNPTASCRCIEGAVRVCDRSGIRGIRTCEKTLTGGTRWTECNP